jgi:two-component system, chemotaxis family, sensor kinase CheA
MSFTPTPPDFERFRATFFEESAEILADLDERLSSLRMGEVDAEGLNAIFRAVHSIKAGAAAFNFTQLVEFAHVFEAMLDRLRDDRIQRSEQVFDVIIRSADVLAELVDAAKDGRETPAGFGADVAAELQEILNGGGGEAPVKPAKAPVKPKPVEQAQASTRTYRIHFEPFRELFRHANEPLLIIRELRRLGQLGIECNSSKLPKLANIDPEDAYLSFIFQLSTSEPYSSIVEAFEFVDEDCALKIEDMTAVDDDEGGGVFAVEGEEEEAEEEEARPANASSAANAPSSPAASNVATPSNKQEAAHAKGATSIRVDLARVDRLVNMVGELVITQAMLAQQLIDQSGGGQRQQWIQGSEELAAHTRELQECVMAIRMQPVKSVFARMPRLVRDISSRLNKKVKLVTSGDQTEVDKTVIEELADPITHMIRNSIDHGVEKEEEARLAAGKPAMATIELSAAQRAGNILITIADDGAGIDRQKVLKAAIAKGLVREDAKLTDDEIHNLIFAPGFSTADKVTEVSGRGVGMDVVRRNIQNLGGRIQIQSTPGKGTRFTLVIPLTLAVLDGMLVAVGKEKYILPLASIVGTIRPEKRQVRTLTGGSQIVSVRGEYIRLIALHRIFNVPEAIVDPSKALLVVVETENGGKAGLVVDELIGQQQVVVKSLSENSEPVPGISGATILGNGRVALILDLEAICAMPDRSQLLDEDESIGRQADGADLQPLPARLAAEAMTAAKPQPVHARR